MTKKLSRIEPRASLIEVTTDRIRDAIISGDLALGTKLSEQRLADMLGVSRSPVSNALTALQSEGLVNIWPKRGSFVFTPNLEEIDDICEHRCVLEIASVRRAIAQNQDALVQGLSKAIEKMQAATKKDDAFGYTKADIEFHNTIIGCGGNHSIAAAYKRTISPLMALRTHLFTILNATLDNSMGEHQDLLEACRNGKLKQAEKIIEEHTGHLVAAYRTSLNSDE
ncbi:MAG: GntR family transcriptional regulator [Pseudomonadales bacterium]